MPDDPKPNSPLLTLQEAADYLRIEPRTLRGMRQRGEVPTAWIRRGCPRVPKAALDALIEEKTQRPRPQPKKKRRRS